MALFLIVGIGLLVVLLLWKLGRLSSGALSISGAALALGLVGYALQGAPALPGAPVAAKPDAASAALPDPKVRGELIGKFGGEADVLAQADAYFRIDRPDLAARVLRNALDKSPQSPALWTGLGNAMVAHGEGLLSPAAEYCYKRALTIAPKFPGALYFYALALAQNQRAEDAKPVFLQLIGTLPPDAPIRGQLLAELVRGRVLTLDEAKRIAASK